MSEVISTPDKVHSDTQLHMDNAMKALSARFEKLRVGRANAGLLEGIRVTQTAGGIVPLQHIATISVIDVRTLMVTPWDKSQVAAIGKAIANAGLGLNPMIAGTTIRVPVPPLSEVQRKSFVKQVKQEVEAARIEVRRYRQEANTQLKGLVKQKTISEDQEKHAQSAIQKLTDQFIQQMDKLADKKEKELLEGC